jgi:hypothetical protein
MFHPDKQACGVNQHLSKNAIKFWQAPGPQMLNMKDGKTLRPGSLFTGYSSFYFAYAILCKRAMDACAPDALLARVISTLGAEPTGLPSAGLNVPMVRVVMFSDLEEKWKSELHESGQVAIR